MSYTIKGNWKGGWALDIHTTDSIKLPNGKFKNTYTDIGESLNKLKYDNQYSEIDTLAKHVVTFLNTLMVTPYLHVIVPTPPSKQRRIQPVHEIAKKVSEKMNIPFDSNYVVKVKDTGQLKTIDNAQERSNLLNNAFTVSDSYKHKKVLIIDDLFRSGSTLNELTKTMYNSGKVNNVYVVTLTKTRVHR
ncbi:ComF family protein [Aliivibrio fischeri]|uniref:ComF family protein n=1 Tax=Aliivibrio fischeri TaxID=668 RepID=UPI0012DA0F1B|nr:phosphoribosyltransferase family protein [Aliivibrio fischeri]MUJ39700.1 ComF family protein [Aliivibrio fischeri]